MTVDELRILEKVLDQQSEMLEFHFGVLKSICPDALEEIMVIGGDEKMH